MSNDPIREPSTRPCGSCPYRCDVPSGVWHPDEYAKLVEYDRETFDQPPGVFLCHQQTGRPCAGWVAVHDMENNLGLRMAALHGTLDEKTYDAIVDYTTDVPLFGSGREAALHGMANVTDPDEAAAKVIADLTRKRAVRAARVGAEAAGHNDDEQDVDRLDDDQD